MREEALCSNHSVKEFCVWAIIGAIHATSLEVFLILDENRACRGLLMLCLSL